MIARVLPTRVVHLEDAFVKKHRGAVFPSPWTLRRPIYLGSWAVPAGGGLVAPVVPGGERVTIEVFARLNLGEGSGRLWIGAGETRLATFDVGPDWTTQSFGPFDWPADARLVIRGDDGLTKPILVDRAEMRWE